MIHCTTDTAVVVLSYNGKDLHQQFFPLLLQESTHLYDVILINNACTDDTASYVATHFPQVKIVDIVINKGFANGYAEGLKQVKAKYYVLLSADFEVSKGWFAPMHALISQNENIAAIQPKILYQRDKTMFEYAGAGGGFIDKWGYLFCRGRIFFTIEKDLQQYNNNIEVFWASGGCMFVNADVYHQLGGLDDALYAHMEEVDLCWRMKNAGYKIAYCGASTVYHIGGSVISYGSPQKLYYNYRNSLILLFKNLPFSQLWYKFPIRLILDGISGLRSLCKGNWVECKTIIKAHFHFYFSIATWYKKRKLSRKNIKNEIHDNTVYNRSIVVDYFLNKKTTFKTLPFTPNEIN